MDRSSEAEQEHKAEEVEERSSPPGEIVYLAVRKEGEEELQRPTSALFWSGLAAGLSMGFSFMTESMLAAYLPRTDWAPLVSSIGYSVGFLIVILGRQQLFTENTLTVILPLLSKRNGATLLNVARLWATVLAANLIGALAFAVAVAKSSAFERSVKMATLDVARHALDAPFGTTLVRGIFAGWLIALMVWLLPFAESGRVAVIMIITYLVGLGHFSHVIAGAVEVFFAGVTGHANAGEVIMGFLVPALIGNILGGVSLVAAIGHAQVTAGKAEGELPSTD